MNCFKYSSIENHLKSCGQKCKNFKKFLLERVEEKEKLNDILEHTYFEVPENLSQKKAVIYTKRDWRVVKEQEAEEDKENAKQKTVEVTNIFTAKHIYIDILLEGWNNYEFYRIMRKHDLDVVNFIQGICLTFITYNRCFCDRCINLNIRDLDYDEFQRILVFKDFFIPIKNNISLLQISIENTVIKMSCCEHNWKNRLWLGDGLNPYSSICNLVNKKNEEDIEMRSWNDLDNSFRPIIEITEDGMELYDINYGYKLLITGYPNTVNLMHNNGEDMFEIAKENSPELSFDFMILIETRDGNLFTFYLDYENDEMGIDYL